MANEALIYSYRDGDAREQMARYWCQRQYNGDRRPEILDRVRQDLEEFNHVQLAYLYRESGADNRTVVAKLADDYDPWSMQ